MSYDDMQAVKRQSIACCIASKFHLLNYLIRPKTSASFEIVEVVLLVLQNVVGPSATDRLFDLPPCTLSRRHRYENLQSWQLCQRHLRTSRFVPVTRRDLSHRMAA